MVFPEKEYKGKNKALDYIWDKLQEFDLKDVFAIHELCVSGKIVDCVLLCPNRIALVMSVKDYMPKSIKAVGSNRVITFESRPPENVGIDGVLAWRQEVVRSAQEIDIQPELISISICYPFVDEKTFLDKRMSMLAPRELSFLADDFSSKACFIQKVDTVYKYVVGALKTNTDNFFLAYDKACLLGNKLVPGFSAFLASSKNKVAAELAVDLDANSTKELFYGICSFLMRNGIMQ